MLASFAMAFLHGLKTARAMERDAPDELGFTRADYERHDLDPLAVLMARQRRESFARPVDTTSYAPTERTSPRMWEPLDLPKWTPISHTDLPLIRVESICTTDQIEGMRQILPE